MAKVDPRDFILNTDYEMDKIVFYKTGELPAGSYDEPIKHGLSFAPLVFGVFSYVDDFSGPRPIPYSFITPDNTINVDALADSENVYLSYINYAGTPAKIYYRLYGFEPSDSHAHVPSTSRYAGEFILNTDYNYCKLKQKGVVNATSTVTIKHGLGYLPQTLVWGETGGNIFPINTSYLGYPGAPNAKINAQSLVLSNIERAHYRIYYDEA